MKGERSIVWWSLWSSWKSDTKFADSSNHLKSCRSVNCKPSVLPSIHPPTYNASIHQHTHASIHPPTYSCIHPPTYSCIHPPTYSCIHQPTYSCIHPSINILIHPSIRPSVHPRNHASIQAPIHSSNPENCFFYQLPFHANFLCIFYKHVPISNGN